MALPKTSATTSQSHYILDESPLFLDLTDEEHLHGASLAAIAMTTTLTESLFHTSYQDPELAEFENVGYFVGISTTSPPPLPPRQASTLGLPTYRQALSGHDGGYLDREFPSLEESLATVGDSPQDAMSRTTEVRTTRFESTDGASAVQRVAEQEPALVSILLTVGLRFWGWVIWFVEVMQGPE
jgi:hypothetical protein